MRLTMSEVAEVEDGVVIIDCVAIVGSLTVSGNGVIFLPTLKNK